MKPKFLVITNFGAFLVVLSCVLKNLIPLYMVAWIVLFISGAILFILGASNLNLGHKHVTGLAVFLVFLYLFPPTSPFTPPGNFFWERPAPLFGPSFLKEKVAVQGILPDDSNPNVLTVYFTSVGGLDVAIVGAIVKDRTGQDVSMVNFDPVTSPADGSLTKIDVNIAEALPSGEYTLVLVSAKGGSYVSPHFNLP